MIEENFSLKNFNTFKFDVNAKYFFEFDNIDELSNINYNFKENNFIIIGGGSNILFSKDYEGLVLKSENKTISVSDESEDYIFLKVGAGFKWDDFVKFCVDKDYGGVENLSLIPGTVGAAPVQNIGAYGVEAKDVVNRVFAYDLINKTEIIYNNNQCQFEYRNSLFKTNKNLLVTEVEFKLSKIKHKYNIEYGALKDIFIKKTLNIKNIRNEVISIRNSKLPDTDKIGNAGSFFKNPVISESDFIKIKNKFNDLVFYKLQDNTYKIAAGWMIEKCGFKGFKYKNSGVYNKQSLVLINLGNAMPNEIIELSNKIIETIFNKFSIHLEPEVIIV